VGQRGFLRLRVGRYRVLYEVDDQVVRVGVIHLGGSG
jgi:mRNA-degrading endonuclease RelE of RelBE toxin-antitoxin system